MNFSSEISKVNSKEELICFINLLATHFKEKSSDWENQDIRSYLEAIGNWMSSMENYYKNTNKPIPDNINWRFIAEILYVGKIYE